MKKVIFIFIVLVGSFSFSSAKILLEESIKLNNGKSIWVRLDNDGGCYHISVGSIDTDIHGIASNCGNIKGHWSVRANGNGETWVHGGVKDVINEIINNR